MSEALDLDALREVAAKARADHESYFDNGWSSDYADDVTALIAEVDRLHRQITQLADDDALELELAIEEGLNDAHGTSHYECCFNDSVFAAYAARSVRKILRALLQPAPQPVPDNQPEDKL